MELFKYLRTKHISLTGFCEDLGISRVTLYRYKKGIQKIPESITLKVRELTEGKVDDFCSRGRADTTTEGEES